MFVYIFTIYKCFVITDWLFFLNSLKLLETGNLEFKKYLFIGGLKYLDMLNRWAALKGSVHVKSLQ